MYYADLSPFAPDPSANYGKVLAIGWLDPAHDFRQGVVARDFVERLTDLLVNPWQPAVSMGRHSCGFCRFTGGPTEFHLENRIGQPSPPMGIANLWLPGEDVLYVAPSLILHYMDAHGYAPPDEFQAAAMACPPMRSVRYMKAILKFGSVANLPIL